MLNDPNFDYVCTNHNGTTFEDVYEEIKDLVKVSIDSDHPWIVCCDEQGRGANVTAPDGVKEELHEEARKDCLWATYQAGGDGVSGTLYGQMV